MASGWRTCSGRVRYRLRGARAHTPVVFVPRTQPASPCLGLPCLWLLATFPYSEICLFFSPQAGPSLACCCHGNLQGLPGFGGGRGGGLKPQNPTTAAGAMTTAGWPTILAPQKRSRQWGPEGGAYGAYPLPVLPLAR